MCVPCVVCPVSCSAVQCSVGCVCWLCVCCWCKSVVCGPAAVCPCLGRVRVGASFFFFVCGEDVVRTLYLNAGGRELSPQLPVRTASTLRGRSGVDGGLRNRRGCDTRMRKYSCGHVLRATVHIHAVLLLRCLSLSVSVSVSSFSTCAVNVLRTLSLIAGERSPRVVCQEGKHQPTLCKPRNPVVWKEGSAKRTN